MPGVRVRNPRDLLFGLFLIGVGVIGLVEARSLEMGEALEMGPGYFPMVLSVLVLGFGLVIGASSLVVEGPPLGRWAWWPMTVVLGAIVLFGLVIERLGLAPTAAAVVVVSSVAAPERRWREVLLFAVLLAAACVVVFHLLLGLPLRVWPS